MHIIYTRNPTRRKDGGTKPAAEQDQENPRASLANSRGNPTQERKGRGTQHSKQALENLLGIYRNRALVRTAPSPPRPSRHRMATYVRAAKKSYQKGRNIRGRKKGHTRCGACANFHRSEGIDRLRTADDSIPGPIPLVTSPPPGGTFRGTAPREPGRRWCSSGPRSSTPST